MIAPRNNWQPPRRKKAKPDPEATFAGHEARLKMLEAQNKLLREQVDLLLERTADLTHEQPIEKIFFPGHEEAQPNGLHFKS